MPDEVGSLEASALKRKERLAALREAKSKKKSDGDKKLPTFRSYKPADESLKELALPEADAEEITDKVKEELENEDKGVVMESLDFTNLAPKKTGLGPETRYRSQVGKIGKANPKSHR